MRPASHLLVLIVIAAIALAAIYIFYNHNAARPVSFQTNNRTYNITYYAYTEQQREEGLMNATVTNTTFMLFRFDSPGIYSFWMKNTYYPLDIIWLEYNASTETANVVYVVNAVPCVSYSNNQSNCIVYTPSSYANYVLEAKSGFADHNMLKTGTKIKFMYK